MRRFVIDKAPLLKPFVPKSLWTVLRNIYRVLTRPHPISRHVQSGYTSHLNVLNRLPKWVPSSANFWRYPELTYETINLYPDQVRNVMSFLEIGNPSLLLDANTKKLSEFGDIDQAFTTELANSFSKFGSDKSDNHSYFRFYADLFAQYDYQAELDVLEIGIGTNNPAMPSTMGVLGNPGASLRAFKECLPNSNVYGADIDSEILFEEERIKTAYVNQFDPTSFDAMVDTFKQREFDVIIDDGLHSVTANLGTLNFALKHLKQNGTLVIEDIHQNHLSAWHPVATLLSGQYECFFVEDNATPVAEGGSYQIKVGYLFILRNNNRSK